MTNQVIPVEAIEAAARGLADQAWGDWEFVPGELRRLFLRDARTALEAAAPHMLATAWDEGYEQGTLSQFQEPRNPYRPTP